MRLFRGMNIEKERKKKALGHSNFTMYEFKCNPAKENREESLVR